MNVESDEKQFSSISREKIESLLTTFNMADIDMYIIEAEGLLNNYLSISEVPFSNRSSDIPEEI